MKEIADRITEMAARVAAHSKRHDYLMGRVVGILMGLMISHANSGHRDQAQYLQDLIIDLFDISAQEAGDVADMTEIISDLCKAINGRQ